MSPRATIRRAPASKPVYAAFLFIPGREFVLFGDDHESVAAAEAHLEGLVREKYREATQMWVCEVKSLATWEVMAKWR